MSSRIRAAVAAACSIAVLLASAGIARATAPKVSSLSPNNGPAAGGTSVSITGTGFISGTTVKFGEVAGSGVTIHSSTSITATSPKGSGTVNVTVHNSNGTSAAVAGDQFAYDPVLSGPWLGVDGSSGAAGAGGIGLFPAHNVVFDAGDGAHAEGGIDFEAGETPAAGDGLERSIDAGMVPVVRIEFHGYFEVPWGSSTDFPHTTEQIDDYAKEFVKTAKAIREAYPSKEILFELMDNPWGYTTPQSNGAEYANVVAKVLPEAKTAGIPLDDIYVYAFGRDLNTKEEWTEGWVPSMYEADPQLETEVQGWSFHPFGPPTGTEENDTGGIEAVPAVRQLMFSGENNVIVGGIGFCARDVLEGEECGAEEPDSFSTSAEAVKALGEVLQTARGYHGEGWLKALLVYARKYGGWSLELPGGELTKQGEKVDEFADTYTPHPAITSLSTNNGPAAGGTTVTITGTTFLPASTVKFGETSATDVTVHSETEITATSPSGSGMVDVKVSNANGTSVANAHDQFAYDPVLSGPWLGVDGSSGAAGAGGIGLFPAHNVVFDAGDGAHAEGGIDFEAGETPAAGDGLERSIDAGMVPVVRIEFHGYFEVPWGSSTDFPHTTEQIDDYAKEFVKTAKAIREAYPSKEILFELMDNPWGYTTPQSNGAEYANVVAKVLPEAKTAGIPLDDIYVYAFGRDLNTKEEWTEGWVPSMYEADPQLETEVQGWSFHPFGPPTGTEENDTGGIEAVPAVRQLMFSGENNVIVGGIGFCARDVLEGEECGAEEPDSFSTSAEAVKALGEVLQTARGYHGEGWLKALLVYARKYGGWSLELPGGELTKQGEKVDEFADTYTPHQPEVSSISPNNGPDKGGTEVTIAGTGFAAGSSVKFGSKSAAEVKVDSWTSISATAPEGSGTVDVTVTNTNGKLGHKLWGQVRIPESSRQYNSS